MSFGKKYEDNFSSDIFKEIKIATVAKEPSSRGSFFVLCKLSKREPVDIIIESRGKKKKNMSICRDVYNLTRFQAIHEIMIERHGLSISSIRKIDIPTSRFLSSDGP